MFHRTSVFASFAVLAVTAAFSNPAKGEESAELLNDLRITWQGRGQLVLPSENQERTFQLDCQGKVAIEGKKFRARAERVRFDAKEKVLTLESDGPVHVELDWKTNGDRITSRLSARRIILRINDGRFELHDANVELQRSATAGD